MMQTPSYTLGEIAKLIGAKLVGDEQQIITGFASLEKAQPGQISFLVNSRYQLVSSSRHEKLLPLTKASAVLLAPEHSAQCPTQQLVVDDPYQGLIKLANLFKRQSATHEGVHPTAIIGSGCSIGNNVTIGAYAVIGEDCSIGDNTHIGAHCVINTGAAIAKDSYIHPRVTIYEWVQIGERAVIHSGAVIGREGFGLVRDQHGWKSIPHLGRVIIGNDVLVGANTTIDRGSFDDTIIEDGVKLDNLIQIAHGVKIGAHTVMAGCSGIAGSTRVGKNCMIGGATCISDNVVIGDNVIFTGMAQVTKSILKPGIYSSGTGIQPQKEWHKSVVRLHNLDEMARKLRKMEKENDAEHE